MPRKPKAKDGLTAGQRVALYESQLEEKRKSMKMSASEEKAEDDSNSASVESANEAPKKARMLEKPQYATVNVDLSLKIGEVKPLHSMCNGPKSYGADISHLFRDIGVPFVRFDCTDTAMSAYAVDISRIFKSFDSDPTDPANYDFTVTDSYVEAAMLVGAKVIFRLGESIDIISKMRREIPESIETLARVCVNIIRHYNEGWAQGYSFGIEYFELWNSSGEKNADEYGLYRSLANSLKLYNEDIKLGGMSFPISGGAVREFLRYCRKYNVPLDFVSVDCFASDPDEVGRDVESLIMLMRNLGFSETELIIGKWCYADAEIINGTTLELIMGGRSGEAKRKLFEAQSSVRGAAFVTAVLLRLMNTELKTACFYDAQPMVSPFCAISDRFGKEQKPYYSFKSFGELYRAKNSVWTESAQIDGMDHTGIYAGAAVSDDGKGYILLSSFKGCGVVDLRIDGLPSNVYTADIYMLDGVKDMTLADSVPISGMKKRLLLNVSEYGVIMIKLY